MICLNCGKHVDDDVRVCPFCGSVIADADEAQEADPLPITISAKERGEGGFERLERSEPAAAPAPESAGKGFLTPAFILSLLSFVLSLICLLTIFSLRGAVVELKNAQTSSLDAVAGSLQTANERLDQLDATLARVQSEAYEQVASQSISITKDLTPLVGPVDEGKNNQMFIVKAKGNLNRDTSFEWQKYNETTGSWFPVVFTGDATTNEQYGLRLENQYDAATGEYTSILWAQFITPDAAGTYRCVITDAGGFTKTSTEAPVSITPAEEG
jgi:hypothetical protein